MNTSIGNQVSFTSVQRLKGKKFVEFDYQRRNMMHLAEEESQVPS